jgi:hypothetical protein
MESGGLTDIELLNTLKRKLRMVARDEDSNRVFLFHQLLAKLVYIRGHRSRKESDLDLGFGILWEGILWEVRENLVNLIVETAS